RLAVVVIARGADGRNHFPAAVAGHIYRDLGVRFGASATGNIAGIGDSQTQPGVSATKVSAAALERDSASDDDESEAADDDSATNATPQKVATPRTIWGDPRRPSDSKVKRVVMPLSNRTEPTAKPAKASPQTESKPA